MRSLAPQGGTTHPSELSIGLSPSGEGLRLQRLLPRPGWEERAACRGQGHEPYYSPQPTRAVRETCQACPVQADCLIDGLVFEERIGYTNGFLAGVTANERLRIRAQLDPDSDRAIRLLAGTPPASGMAVSEESLAS